MSMFARVIMLLALTIALGVSAQEEARKAPANAKVAIPSPESAASRATAPSNAPDDKSSGKPSGKNATPDPTPDHFEPSEKVRADFDVSFPVDI